MASMEEMVQECINKLKPLRKKGATKHCAHGTCSSDSRYSDRPEMKGVFFIRFPQMKKYPEKCKRWAVACSRQDFSENNVKKDTYICSLHFIGGKGPTDDHPDPVPETDNEVAHMMKKSRKRASRKLALSLLSVPTQKHSTSGHIPNETEDKFQTEIANILLSLSEATNQPASCDQVGVESGPTIKRSCYSDRNNIETSKMSHTPDVIHTKSKG